MRGSWIGILGLIVLLGGCASSGGEVEPPKTQLVFKTAENIYFLQSYGSLDDLDPPSAFKEWIIGEDASSAGTRFAKPFGVAVGKGKLFINDGRRQSGYWVFDLEQREMTLIRDKKLLGSTGIAVDEREHKYLTVPGIRKAKAQGTVGTKEEDGGLLVFDENNQLLKEKEFSGRPVQIAVLGERLYVTDALKNRVVILERDSLEVLGSFGKTGKGEAEFSFPKGITTNGVDQIIVGDVFNGKVKVFDPAGKFVSQYGYRTQLLGGFLSLGGLAVDRKGMVYTVDSAYLMKLERDEVQVFDSRRFYKKGEKMPALEDKKAVHKKAMRGYFQKPYATSAGSSGSSSTMYSPVDIAVDYHNTIYFQEFAPSGVKFEYLIWLTSQFSGDGKNLSLFAVGTPSTEVKKE